MRREDGAPGILLRVRRNWSRSFDSLRLLRMTGFRNMDSVLDGGGQLEREMKPDPLAAPVTGSVVLHLAILVGIPLYMYFNGFLHHNWGNPGPGSAIQVSLDSA